MFIFVRTHLVRPYFITFLLKKKRLSISLKISKM